MVSFEQNNLYIYNEMKRQQVPIPCVFLYKGKNKQRFDEQIGMSSIELKLSNVGDFIKAIYHLQTSKKVVVDNYFGELAGITFRKQVECVQIWHAAGAVKTFGFEDKSTLERTNWAQKRFANVYQHFHRIVVGSDVMAERFLAAFHLPPSVILRTGVPRTDLFYNEKAKELAIQKWTTLNPELSKKKVILYAPTYRDQELEAFQLELDISEMQRALSDQYVLILKLHPAIKNDLSFSELDGGFVMNYSNQDINELLFISDLLITDYSSIPVEYSILEKPMIFFAYDEDTYLKDRGLWEPYETSVPGPIVRTTAELIRVIKEESYDLSEVRAYSEVWNKYSKGQSSRNIVEYLIREDK
ncbi:CDP-glycerol glycerophosphotransferase family protein [Pullulanibacillus sp. KACC 23026]|uniref:CDP-glycerol glycerophosphotransferase family protein n=1 Tax=Pullulanibacillus sp. KACC 23026 TaxID=3028315 RepID=UPI0023B0F7D1|nr:CDP-glycerol glycerophosphotransferase family protein [Pullulanibacillus sp. KACC 23026]WEG13138.1 CDP-glycerol glycerophosphotransferase family protein [Pullulanibacillus sp. KACC 23026]